EGLAAACQKRPVAAEQIDAIVEQVERRLQESGDREVPSTLIGEHVMKSLQALDDVAYIRFASVYRSFQDISEFMSVLRDLAVERRAQRKERGPA
ncbi:MAG: transcriptional regulator NrdR, partial [Pseudomonadota bacterium]